MDERKKLLQAIGKETMLQDMAEDFAELVRQGKKVSAVKEFILDDYYLWMSISPENERAAETLLKRLIEKNGE